MNDAIDIIRRKREGLALDAAGIDWLIGAYMAGEVPDYQMSAWLMAVCFKGLDMDETLALTDALVASGVRLDHAALGRMVVDKHSTGGVGDKVTLVLGPVMAACGAVFGKMSGRGLGHTGGTVDKLESIPGFRTGIEPEEFERQLADIGLCVSGQSAGMVPADKKLYALRDVTATIESNPLVAASIMSKKIAGGAGAVVLDIKVGGGAFFRTRGHAAGAEHLMESIGQARGLRVETLLTAMDQPLGHAVGNSLEVLEALRTLKGDGPPDLVEVVIALASKLLALSDLGWDASKAQKEAQRSLADGSALAKFSEWICAQGGDAACIDDPDLLGLASTVVEVKTTVAGFVAAIDALEVGRLVQDLGAGRHKKDEAIDHGVGAVLHAKVGGEVTAGETIATVYGPGKEQARAAAERLLAAYRLDSQPVAPVSPLLA
ncbi:MAG: thymidine phosphorylase [Thermoleophilia bacterium]